MKKVSLILSSLVVIMIIISCGSKNSNEVSTINDSSKTKELPITNDTSKTKELPITNEITIGNQVWMNKNLNVDKFRNGDPIPEAKTFEEWEIACNNRKPVWCYYNFDSTNGEKYGKLYNVFAFRDGRNLAPEGFRLPNDNDWITLVNFLGGTEAPDAGKKLKSTSDWMNNGNGTNIYGWSGLPGGFINGKFEDGGKGGDWWGGKALKNDSQGDSYSLGSEHDRLIHNETINNENLGISVRCRVYRVNIQVNNQNF